MKIFSNNVIFFIMFFSLSYTQVLPSDFQEDSNKLNLWCDKIKFYQEIHAPNKKSQRDSQMEISFYGSDYSEFMYKDNIIKNKEKKELSFCVDKQSLGGPSFDQEINMLWGIFNEIMYTSNGCATVIKNVYMTVGRGNDNIFQHIKCFEDFKKENLIPPKFATFQRCIACIHTENKKYNEVDLLGNIVRMHKTQNETSVFGVILCGDNFYQQIIFYKKPNNELETIRINFSDKNRELVDLIAKAINSQGPSHDNELSVNIEKLVNYLSDDKKPEPVIKNEGVFENSQSTQQKTSDLRMSYWARLEAFLYHKLSHDNELTVNIEKLLNDLSDDKKPESVIKNEDVSKNPQSTQEKTSDLRRSYWARLGVFLDHKFGLTIVEAAQYAGGYVIVLVVFLMGSKYMASSLFPTKKVYI